MDAMKAARPEEPAPKGGESIRTALAMSARARRETATWRRSLFFGLTLLSTLFGAVLMLDILRANGITLLEAVGLVLFLVLFAWIGGAFWTAVAGFIVRIVGRDSAVIHPDHVTGRTLRGRIAIVMPVYNEDPERVAAGIDAVWRSLQAESEQHAFDFFILSDTRKPDIATQEEAAWRALVARYAAAGRIFYRRRTQNIGRKAGNIADFVNRWGAAYDYMIVLDADSIMTGHALVTLARLMDAHPRVGILQTLPLPTGRDTLFARIVQFASRLNGPMLASGLAFWQLGESNYWGHNAILRIRPFAEHCALPQLPGRAPLGGEILSHDFVEAAFMRRAGYEVWMVPDLGGSWEEVPSNVIDYAARDRRWAQGNLQHLKLLSARGLHWLSRVHLVTGVAGYVTSPIWMTVLVLSSIVACLEALRVHQYFEPGAIMLFPNWPETRAGEIASLLAITIGMLLLPKVLGAVLVLRDASLRRGFGGAGRLGVSLIAEQAFSMLLAPTMMVFHSMFVIQTLAGIPVVWSAQERGDRGIGLAESLARHKWHVALGLAWLAIIVSLAPAFVWWMMPVITGLLLSVLLTVCTSRAGTGRLARSAGLFLTPEETEPPLELAAVRMPPAEAALVETRLERSVPPVPATPTLAPLPMEAMPLERWRIADQIGRIRGVGLRSVRSFVR